MDELEVVRTAGLEDTERAHDVGFDRFYWMEVGIGDGNERAEVVNEVDGAGGAFEGVKVAQVTVYQLNFREDFRRQETQQTEVRAAGIAQESSDVGTVLDKGFDQAIADEAARAGDENFFTVKF